jgi:hypothetical protein
MTVSLNESKMKQKFGKQQSRLEGNAKKDFRVFCEDGGGCKYQGNGSSKGFGTNGTELSGYSAIQLISQIIFFH